MPIDQNASMPQTPRGIKGRAVPVDPCRDCRSAHGRRRAASVS